MTDHAPEQRHLRIIHLRPLQQGAQLRHACLSGVGIQKSHLQQQRLRVGQGGFQAAAHAGFTAAQLRWRGRRLACAQGMQANPHRVGQVEGGIGVAAAEADHLTGLEKLAVAQTAILPAKHERSGGLGVCAV